MKNYKLTYVLLLVFFFFIPLKAQITLPSVFGDNMVLQQKSDVSFWGWAEPGRNITVSTSWDTVTYRTKCLNTAKWIVKMHTPGAGGPFTITIKGSDKLTLKNVLIGEVWLCSGQSNMEMNATWGIFNADSVVKHADNPNIRLFQVKRIGSDYPQENCSAEWKECSPESMKMFSAAGYFFGKQLHDSLKVPIGLINASWGGTPAEPWVKKEIIVNDSVLKAYAEKLKPSQWWPIIPGETYNSMIAPLLPYSIAGTIWYQGESNVGTASGYKYLLSTLIQSWRKDFQKDFPFYYVQIAPHTYSNPQGRASSYLREAQEQALEVPNTGMIVISDLVDNVNDIHPKDKADVGKRLANMALAKTYGFKNVPFQYPMFSLMKIEKNKIRIYFSNAEKGLISRNGSPTTFEIAGEDQKFVPAQAKIEKSTVVVWSPDVKKPVAVRFSFTNADMPNLFSKEGLPVAPFRTDNYQ